MPQYLWLHLILILFRALGKVEEAEAIEATMKMKSFTDSSSQAQPVFSTDLNLFNQGQGLTLSNWESSKF